jgi:hypothetical protein
MKRRLDSATTVVRITDVEVRSGISVLAHLIKYIAKSRATVFVAKNPMR